jgi:hypothetical protein
VDAVAQAELREDPAHVGLDSRRFDRQLGCDLVVSQAGGDECEDLAFSRGELVQSVAFGRVGQRVRRHPLQDPPRDRRDTDEAIVAGISHTGRLVTSAALIIFFAFATMGAAGATDVKMLATGLAGGILLDALVVRTLLVPATVSIFGRWNWWLPDTARRLLRLPPD